MNTPSKTYTVRFISAMAAYAVLLVVAILAARGSGSAWRIPLMLLPVLPIGYGLFAFIRFFDSMDEMHKQAQLSAMATALGGTAILTFTYGMLENAGFPQLSYIWIFPLIAALWGSGLALAYRRYQ